MKKISKKSNRRGPLALNKETLRNLSEHGEKVVGGTLSTVISKEWCPIPETALCPTQNICTLQSLGCPRPPRTFFYCPPG